MLSILMKVYFFGFFAKIFPRFLWNIHKDAYLCSNNYQNVVNTRE